MSADHRAEEAVSQFLATAIPSLWALETLLFLRRQKTQAWSVAQLVRELRSSDSAVGDSLRLFEVAGLVVQRADGYYQYNPINEETDRVVAAVERLYIERPVTVRSIILKNPREKLISLADSFRFTGPQKP